ncbi:putative MFS-type transporter EfpA [Mycobacterium talmoniae]|uniref:Putative MFS-type transporter EfpA n=1 Tax=Mycobacterium talmoniae TaxID=1858794 RepID=A0A2S8BKP0_9MYCO|nr:putative MFS-type transporter EfpA [Mycobacterium talmoniae]
MSTALGSQRPSKPQLSASVLGIAIVAITGMQLMSTLDGTIVIAAVTRLAETRHERLKLDVSGALLATLGCSCGVLVFTQGPPRGWVDPWVIGAGVAAAGCGLVFLIVERSAENPLVPLAVFDDRNRVATFVAYFLAGGVMLTVSVMIGLLVQDVLGYSALRAGICFIPFAVGMGIGNVLTTRVAALIAPRWLVIGAGALVLGAMLFGSTLQRDVPYFPDLLTLFVVGGFGIGVISVILPLCAVAGVGPAEIGPVSAITLMVYNLGGPLVLVVIQAVQVSRTLYLGGVSGPITDMTSPNSMRWATATPIRCCGWRRSRCWWAPPRCLSASPRARSASRNTPRRRWRPGSCRASARRGKASPG